MKIKGIFKRISRFSFSNAHRRNAPHRNTTQSAEYGRSMVEMLGVLAVIGVLSVAGIAGYRYAMDKYRSNDIIYEVNLRNRDTWHKYQLDGLPENEDRLNEWAEYTSTGFPIGVYLRSTDMFDVQVDDVPSRVCLNVLNTNLEGPLLIWVPTGENEKQLFDGTNAEELCQYGEEDAENVSIVFTTSLSQYGAELGNEAVDENGRPVRYCLDDGDCTGTCERCGSDYKCESTCPDATPICSATQGKCVRCEVNDDCPINQICNEATNECEEIPEACAENEFRSRNGACIPCSHPSNVIINGDEVFGADKATGAELCANCANEGTARKLETAGDTTYCSYTCTKGISVQGQDGQCHPCVNPDGTPNTEVFEIDGGTEAKEQCLACGDREWVQMGKMWCSPLKCESNQFIGKEYDGHIGGGTEYPPICIDCSSSRVISYLGIAGANADSFSGPTNKDTLVQLCNNCPNRQELNSYCVKKCEQPDENSEESTICKTDPGNEKCKRKWQNGYGACLSCNQNGNSSLIFANRISSTLADLCEKCGRQVTPDGNCAPKQNLCSEGQIMDVSGNCISCTSASSAITILSDEESGCTACNKDGQEIRWVISYTNGNTNLPIVQCMKKCNENQFQGTNGVCYDCSDSSSPYAEGEQLQSLCLSCSKPNERTLFNNQRRCGKKVCATNEFQDTYGVCLSCNNTESGDLRGIDSEKALLCEACGNRIKLGFCALINPGVSGVCNSLENGAHENYPDGDGKYFRDNTGYCRRCDDPKTYTPSSIAQCKSCGNRRNDGGCALGLCTDGTTFLNVNNQCISCTTSSRTEIDNITTSRSSCTECDNKRVMTAEDTSGATKAYCVNDCFGQLQNVNGQCGGSSWSNFEIGSDETSKSMCRNYERVVYSKANGDQTRWYCSSAPRDGYFININGGLSSCTSGSTEIPDSNDARNLCLDCSGAKRTVIEKDGRFYCEKS